MEEPSEQGIANGRRTSITATLALNNDPPVRGTWEETASVMKGKIDAAEATLDRMIYMMGDSPPQVRCEIPVSMKREETKDKTSKAPTLPALELSLDHLPSGQLDNETESNSVMTFEETDDKSEMIAVKSNDGTEAETAGVVAGETPDAELHQLKFQYRSLHTDKEISPEGGCLSVDKCSLAIPPKSLFDTRHLGIFMSMDFKNLGLPANRIPVTPYLGVIFNGELRIPAKARLPTWFKPLKNSKHGIKIYKRYRVGENKFAWRELQNEVTVHDEFIEFEVDHFCGFIGMRILNSIKDRILGNSEIKLSHGLLNRGENFVSAICYRTPKSLFQQMIAHLKKIGYKEIYSNRFVMKSTQKVPIRIECVDPDLHSFLPRERLLTLSNLSAEGVQLPFMLRHLREPKDEVDIRYIVNDFSAPLRVKLLDTKGTPVVCQYCLLDIGNKSKLAQAGNWLWENEIYLSHGLFQRGREFSSVICHRSSESLFDKNVAVMEKMGYKEICHGNFSMNASQKVTARMESIYPRLYEFEPRQYLLTHSDMKFAPRIRLSFILQQRLVKPKEEVTICTAHDFSFWFADTQATFVSGTADRGIPDDELQQLEFQYRTLHTDKIIGPEGANLSIDECSLTIRPYSVVDTRNLCMSMSMNFQDLAFPADKTPISPYLNIKFQGELLIPAIARLPTWFRPSTESKHGIIIYKRCRDEENSFIWRELQSEVKVHNDIIEFEVDHFCIVVPAIPDWVNGEIVLSHGLFQRRRNFRSVICYCSSLFQQIVDDLNKSNFEEIHRDLFLMNNNRAVPVKMECIDMDLHEFDPRQYLLTPSNIKVKGIVRFYFALRHRGEPTNEVDIRYIVDDSSASLVVGLPAIKAPQRQQPELMRVTTEFKGAATIQNLHLLGTGSTHDHRQYPRIHIHGGVLLFCGISILFLGFFLALGLFYGMSPRFLQSYSTGHDEI